MRIFIAVNFDYQTKQELSKIAQLIRSHAVKGRFTDVNNFHLTLKFIGEMDEEQLFNLYNNLNEVSRLISFNIQMKSISFFKRNDGMLPFIKAESSDELINLFHKVDEIVCETLNISREQSIKPHITLGRKVFLKQKEILDTPLDINYKVKSITIMESKNIAGKLTYIPKKEITLC